MTGVLFAFNSIIMLQMLRIPVIQAQAWERVKHRLHVAPLTVTKKLNIVHEHRVTRLTGLVVYVCQDEVDTLEWRSPLEFKRLKPRTTDMCIMCFNRDIRLNHREGIMVCAWCGFVCDDHADQEASSYTQSFALMTSGGALRHRQQVPRRHTDCCYKRYNHFRETLARIQGKEKVDITRDHLSRIEEEVARRGLSSDDLTGETIKAILKHLRLVQYYNHRYYLLSHLTGEPLVTLSKDHCNRLFALFVQIQKPYALHSNNRANMMSYLYVIRKLCELQGWTELANQLPMLKSRAKIVQQDEIWRRICRSLDFPFIPSLL